MDKKNERTIKGEIMYTDSQVRNLSNIQQKLRGNLSSWNGASRSENKKKFWEYLGIRMRQRRLDAGEWIQRRIGFTSIAPICRDYNTTRSGVSPLGQCIETLDC